MTTIFNKPSILKRFRSDLGPRRISQMCDKSGEPYGTSWEKLGEYFEWYIEEKHGLHERTYSNDFSFSDQENSSEQNNSQEDISIGKQKNSIIG